ncbi:MAG: hypothetical protein ACKO24_13285 [Leptolyngbyaceae cyanobacterium]
MTEARQTRLSQPLDRAAIALVLVLTLLIGILLWVGKQNAPRVRDFSWQDRNIGADDTAFLISFSRPMNHASVEEQLQITPPLSGKVSWAGRRMAYTLKRPAPYGTAYELQLQGGTDHLNREPALKPFLGRFRTRDRGFAYIGVQGQEAGRLILYNLTRQQKQVLTPENLVVMDFKPYPLGDRMLFSATERANQAQGLLEQKLYTVTTGITVTPPPQVSATPDDQPLVAPPVKPAGEVQLVLDSQDYQNLKFDLSADGRIIVVQRVNRKDPADFGPWILHEGKSPEPLKGEPGGDFLITPDSNSLAISQGQGLAILPLEPNAKPLDFLPKFGVVLTFSRDGSLAAMVKFNADRTRSLFLVSSQGTQKELLRTQGSILNAQFDPTRQVLYCLLTDLVIAGDLYQEKPYLAAIDLKTSQLNPLLELPEQRDIQMSLAPDGIGILFDQISPTDAGASDTSQRTQDGKAIENSQLWLLPLDLDKPTVALKLETLPLNGMHPRWLP